MKDNTLRHTELREEMRLPNHRAPSCTFIVALALVAGPGNRQAAIAACTVKSFVDREVQQDATPRVVAPIKTLAIGATSGPLHAASPAPPSSSLPPPPPQMSDRLRRDRAIWAAIETRNTQEFREALAADGSPRSEALLRTHALDRAFMAGALPIVELILRWMPDSLTTRTQSEKTELLSTVASSWSNHESGSKSPENGRDWIALMRLLLDVGADANGRLQSSSPLTSIAGIPSSADTLAAAELLLTRGANLAGNCKVCWPPLTVAAQRQNHALVEVMLRHQTATQAQLDDALVNAPLTDSNKAIELLLAQGANINVDDTRYRRTPGDFSPVWHVAMRVQQGRYRDLLQLLIRYKADPNRTPNRGNSPLMIVMHDHGLMQGLLKIGANPNYRSFNGDSPLHLAIRIPQEIVKAPDDSRPLSLVAPGLDGRTRARSVELLLAYGADASQTDGSSKTPLMLVSSKDEAIIQMLLKRGGTINLESRNRAEYRPASVGPVSWALLHGNDALAVGLLARDGKLESDDCGAVYYAAQTNGIRTLSLLLTKKLASPELSDEAHRTPLMIAAHIGSSEAIRLLLEHQVAKVDERVPVGVEMVGGHGPSLPMLRGGTTALMIAAAADQPGAIRELLRRGAKVNSRDILGATALKYARARSAEQAESVLIANGARE